MSSTDRATGKASAKATSGLGHTPWWSADAASPSPSGNALLEDGTNILLEDGTNLELEG